MTARSDSISEISPRVLVYVLIFVIIGVMVTTGDRPVNATPELQGITVANSLNVDGILTSDESLAWQTTNYGPLNSPPLSMPYPANVLTTDSPFYFPIDKLGEQTGDIIFWDIFNFGSEDPSNWGAGQEQFTNGYKEETTAVSGETSYVKSSLLTTGNQIATQDNYKTSKQIVFSGSDGGRLVSDEALLLDGAGSFYPVTNSILCPFAQTIPPTISPEFCNIVQMGSSVDMNSVSLSTQASDKFVALTGDIPVKADYSINVQGISGPASGSANSYINTHIQEGRMEFVTDELDPAFPGIAPHYVYRPGKYEDLMLSETTSASGLITKFSKSMSYQSGFNLI